MKNRNFMKHQRGSALFVMLMILVAMTLLTFMATNMGKTDARISNAYAEQSKAFINAEAMLARLRYALIQMPMPDSVNSDGIASEKRPVWVTKNMTLTKDDGEYNYKFQDGEPDFTNPEFAENKSSASGAQSDQAQNSWNSTASMTCTEISDWMKQTSLSIAVAKQKIGEDTYKDIFTPIDCDEFDPEGKTRTIIELVSDRQDKSDVDDQSNTYYYRITIQGQGDRTGQVLAQGITGIQYSRK